MDAPPPTILASDPASSPAAGAALETAGKVLLVGHPNVGKSVLFNLLSGSNVNVSNYPGTTVDLQHSLTLLSGNWYDLVDTPGTRSLVAASDDERVTQQSLLDNLGVAVIQVGDAKNLRQTLFLTTQLLELDFPLVLALNMLDECREANLLPDTERASERLGTPVCSTTAITGEGVDGLEAAFGRLARTAPAADGRGPKGGAEQGGAGRSAGARLPCVRFPRPIEEAVAALMALMNERLPGKRGLALLFLAGDDSADHWLSGRVPEDCFHRMSAIRARLREEVERGMHRPLALVIHQCRYDRVSELAGECLLPFKPDVGPERRRRWYYQAALPFLGAASGWVSAYLLHFAGLKFLSGPLGISPWLVYALGALAGGAWFLRYGARQRRRGLAIRDSLGELAIEPGTALPLLFTTLYAAYLIIGVFAAGTCVDFIENKVFASVEGGPGFDLGLFLPLSENFTENGEMAGWSLVHVPWKGINHYLGTWAASLISPNDLVYQLFFGPPAAAAEPAGAAAAALSGGEAVSSGAVATVMLGAKAAGAGPGSNRMDMGLVTVGLTYSVAIVLPIVAFFFFIFGLLEDSGYLPRIAMLTDKTFKKIGLNGKAVLPLVLGLGCDTMATMTTRILETRKERTIAVLLLALAVPCSAQIGIIAGVMAKVSPISVCLFVLIILGQLLLIGYLSSLIIRGRAADFIIEIPPIRLPLWRNVFAKTASRLKWFLVEAVPLFIAGTFILFVVQWLGVIPYLVNACKPVVTGLLGLPEETTIGFILGFLRRDFGAVHILSSFTGGDAASAAAIDPRQVLVAVTVITLFIPCLANYFIMVREQGMKTATLMAAFIMPYAIFVGAVLNQALRLLPVDWLKGRL